MSSATLLRLRRPAVSMNTRRWPSYSKGVSIASRVVPGSSVTTSRSWPSKRLTRLDFPTLGRPTTATWITSTSPPGPLSASRGTVVRTATPWASRTPLPLPPPRPLSPAAGPVVVAGHDGRAPLRARLPPHREPGVGVPARDEARFRRAGPPGDRDVLLLDPPPGPPLGVAVLTTVPRDA